MYKITDNETTRKNELFIGEDGFEQLLAEVLFINTDLDPNAIGVYKSTDSAGLYYSGKPSNCPIDLTDVITSPSTNHLISVKVNLSDNSIKVKTYHKGNVKDIVFHKPISGTGVYADGSGVTIYYPSGDEEEVDTTKGFSAITFYADGTNSDESVYTQADAE